MKKFTALLALSGGCASLLAPATMGTAKATTATSVPVYEATNPSTGETFLTTSAKEARGASTYGYTHNDGPVFYASTTSGDGLIAVHRLYNATHGFVFIPEGTELTNAVSKYGYTDNGVAFYASSSQSQGTVPEYRLFNPNQHYVYTQDKSIVTADINSGYKEGFAAFYVKPVDTSKIQAYKNGTVGSSTAIWSLWQSTSDQGDASNHIKFGVQSPRITSDMVGKQIVFWVEGDSTATVVPSLYAGGYEKNGNYIPLASSVTGTNGDVTTLTATLTQDMVGSTIDTGGRASVVIDAPNHPIKAQIWIGGADQGAAMMYVPQPMPAPAQTQGVPSQAASNGLTSKVFNTDFTSMNAIDLTGRGDSTKQWFTDRTWDQPLPSKDLNISASNGLTISPESNNGPNYDLGSISHAGQTGFHFKYGYFQAKLKFDPTIATTPQLTDSAGHTTQVGGWPSWWLYDGEALLKQSIPESSEIDGLEYFKDSSSSGGERYTGSVWNHLNNVNVSNGGTPDVTFPSNYSASDWNTYGILWTPGKIQWDIDGLVSKTLTYGPNQYPVINGVPQTELPIGMFSHLDNTTDGMGMILGTGKGDPLSVANVQVWEAK